MSAAVQTNIISNLQELTDAKLRYAAAHLAEIEELIRGERLARLGKSAQDNMVAKGFRGLLHARVQTWAFQHRNHGPNFAGPRKHATPL